MSWQGKQWQMRPWRACQAAIPEPHLFGHCCDRLTNRTPGCYEICSACFWEDDPGQRPDFDEGGFTPLGLEEARRNYRKIVACRSDMFPHVRPPRPEELPPEV